jgi:hypothetical protein
LKVPLAKNQSIIGIFILLNMSIHTDTLPEATAHVVKKIKNVGELKKFYLSGGTALSLQLGHRESEDLDFFCKDMFDPQLLQQDFLLPSWKALKINIL